MDCRKITTQSRIYPHVKLLLESFDLETSDINDSAVTLWAIENSGQLFGVIGLERSQGIGLLRSLAVAQSKQGIGVAKRLCEEVFKHAAQEEITELYLLTESAAGFFELIGFTEIPRENAPNALRATSQFSDLCPASATVMVKLEKSSH